MPSLDATLYAYAKQHLPSLPKIYTWKFDENVVFHAFGLNINGQNWYEKTRLLKRSIANQWIASPEQRIALAGYVVRVWGGVKRNAAKTIEGYVDTVSHGQLPPTFKGIASWSKVLAFSNPQSHAIFDARLFFLKCSSNAPGKRREMLVPVASWAE